MICGALRRSNIAQGLMDDPEEGKNRVLAHFAVFPGRMYPS
jgi:hypothetical protein